MFATFSLLRWITNIFFFLSENGHLPLVIFAANKNIKQKKKNAKKPQTVARERSQKKKQQNFCFCLSAEKKKTHTHTHIRDERFWWPIRKLYNIPFVSSFSFFFNGKFFVPFRFIFLNIIMTK
jgi:hypothetical protein